MSDMSYAGPLSDWLAQAPQQPPPRVMGKSPAKLLAPYLDPDQAQSAAEAAAARVRAPYAKANARESGLPQIGEYFGNKLASALTAPMDALTGALQVTDPETGMPTREAMERGQGVANLAMTGGVPFARQGAAGMAGGRLAQPEAPERIIGASYTAAGKHYVAPNHVLAMDQAVKDLGLTGTSDLVDLHGGFEGHHAANGFMTSTGRVVNRAEADRIAAAAEQGMSSRPGSLKSEDMKTGSIAALPAMNAYHYQDKK